MNFYDYWILKTNVSSNIKIKLIEDFKTSEEVYKGLIENGNLNYINLNEYDMKFSMVVSMALQIGMQ